MKNIRKSKSRIYYIDNLRIFLISLVVLHHLAITYGAPGGWFYNESVADFPEIIPLSMFVATNQSFFMGMFFFISAFFLVPSLNKKGITRFSKDRLMRLGFPMLLFFFFIFPLTVFVRNKFIRGEDISLWNYITESQVWGIGPMWFVEALLIFSFSYIAWTVISKNTKLVVPNINITNRSIIFLSLFIGICQFIIRIWLPVGWAMPFTEFQLPFFVQYITLFALGIIAYKQNWLDNISPKMAKQWMITVQLLIFIAFPILFVLGGAIDNGPSEFMGGLNWKNLCFAIWEQIVGIGMIVALLGIFKSRLNAQTTLAKKLSASAYAVYVVHPFILVSISYLALEFNIHHFWKFVVLAPITLIWCYLIGHIIKKLPILNRVF